MKKKEGKCKKCGKKGTLIYYKGFYYCGDCYEMLLPEFSLGELME